MRRTQASIDAQWTSDTLSALTRQVDRFSPDDLKSDMDRCQNMVDPLSAGVVREYYRQRAQILRTHLEGLR